MTRHQLSVVTLGVADMAASRRFYVDGFGWRPVFENAEIIFYQMNGFVLGTWLATKLAEDSGREATPSGGFALAHNVAEQSEVEPLLERLANHGGTIARPADAPAHGGYRGYVADLDGHALEIAFNPAWTIDAQGHVTFEV